MPQSQPRERITDHFVRKSAPGEDQDQERKKRKFHFAERLQGALEEGIAAGAVNNSDVEALERFMFQQRREKMSKDKGKGKGKSKGQIQK